MVPDPTTILALHRLHSSISRTSKKLRNPQRLLLPHISTFLPLAPHQPHTTPRIRTPLPLPLHHPFLLKSAFPAVGVEYKEDWDDYCLMEMPWVFERLVLVDQGAARRAAGTEGLHAVLRLDERSDWWTPIRATLLRSLSLPVDTPPEGAKPVVTYISRQNATAGPKLRGADHTALLQALKRERLEVIVVEDGDSVGEKAGGVWTDEGKRWDALSRAVIRSNVSFFSSPFLALSANSLSSNTYFWSVRLYLACTVHICFLAPSCHQHVRR